MSSGDHSDFLHDAELQSVFDVRARVNGKAVTVALRRSWAKMNTFGFVYVKRHHFRSEQGIHNTISVERNLLARVNGRDIYLPIALINGTWFRRDGVRFCGKVKFENILQLCTALNPDCVGIIKGYDEENDHIKFASILFDEKEEVVPFLWDAPLMDSTLAQMLFQFVKKSLPFDVWKVDAEKEIDIALPICAIEVAHPYCDYFVRLVCVYVREEQSGPENAEDSDMWLLNENGLCPENSKLTKLPVLERNLGMYQLADSQCERCHDSHLGMCGQYLELDLQFDLRPGFVPKMRNGVRIHPTSYVTMLPNAEFSWVMPSKERDIPVDNDT